MKKKLDIIEFLKLIRAVNPYGRIMIILDNFRSHHANLTTQTAAKLNIDLVFLPPIVTTPKTNRIHLENNKKTTITIIHRNQRTTKKHNRQTLQKILKITNKWIK